MYIFELRDLTISVLKKDQPMILLENVNLKVAPHEHIGLFAPIGKGKTTLIYCLTGIKPKDSGEIFFHGKEVKSERDFQSLRRGIGVVLQDTRRVIFFPKVIEDVMFGLLNLGFDCAEAEERSLKMLEQLGILDLKDQNTWNLSGGERRLVALADILVMQPEVLIMDEPTSGLDKQSVKRLERVLEKLSCARFVVTHDRRFLQRVVDTCYTIMDRKLVLMPLEDLSNEKFFETNHY